MLVLVALRFVSDAVDPAGIIARLTRPLSRPNDPAAYVDQPEASAFYARVGRQG